MDEFHTQLENSCHYLPELHQIAGTDRSQIVQELQCLQPWRVDNNNIAIYMPNTAKITTQVSSIIGCAHNIAWAWTTNKPHINKYLQSVRMLISRLPSMCTHPSKRSASCNDLTVPPAQPKTVIFRQYPDHHFNFWTNQYVFHSCWRYCMECTSWYHCLLYSCQGSSTHILL